LLGATFSKQGAKMQPGSVLSLGEMPFYYYTDPEGDQVALPCTERMLSSKTAELVAKHRFIPLLSIKGRPEVRLAGFTSLAGGLLAGPWKPVTKSTPPPAQAPPEAEKEPEAEAESEAAPEAAAEAEAAPAGEDTTESQPAEEAVAAEGESKAEAGDPELDKLLASLSEEPTAPAEPQAATEGGAEEPEMDPELAKLLKELGS